MRWLIWIRSASKSIYRYKPVTMRFLKLCAAVIQLSITVSLFKESVPKFLDIALSTDVIVGFPGETEEQFLNTFNLLSEIRFDMVHVAAYSPRPGTLAAREMEDNVPPEVKKERLEKIEKSSGQDSW